MSNDPYPSAATLHAEVTADLLLVEHDRNVQLFRNAVIKCLASIAPLVFPLGSPCPGYDVGDMEMIMESWLLPVDPRKLDDEAWDKALAEAVP